MVRGRWITGVLLGALVAAFCVWTSMVISGAVGWLDRTIVPPVIAPRSAAGQILETIALVTYPGIVFLAVAGYSIWAFRRRLRRLAWAIALTIPVGWGGYWLLKQVFRRARPDSPFADSLTYGGFAYPSGHMVAITILSATVVTFVTAQRRPTPVIWLVRLAGASVVAGVALNRWLMRQHWPTDIVGGLLYGGSVAAAALLFGGAGHLAESLGFPGRPNEHVDRRAAVIVNPSKVTDYDLFRRRVEYELRHRGWRPPIWLETAVDDPGRQMSADALDRGADLVLVAGGDGTVRTVCSELAGTGTPVALIPAGTANQLARNLGIPLDEDAALALAFEGHPVPLDVVRYATDDDAGHFVVMSGLGLDAAIMAQTRPELKKLVGSAAYFLAAAQQVGVQPFEVTVTIDDQEPITRLAIIALVGNVGTLNGTIQVFPDADPYDGRLNILVANPTSALDWARVATGLLGADVEPLEFAHGRRVRFEVTKPVAYQLDGDADGTTSVFEAEVVPGALTLMLPRGR